MSTESVHDIGSDRSEESCGSADTALMRASRGINIVFPDLLKATDDCRRRPIGLRADAQIDRWSKTRRRIMKALIAALALATLIAVPTLPANAAPMSPASSSFGSNGY